MSDYIWTQADDNTYKYEAKDNYIWALVTLDANVFKIEIVDRLNTIAKDTLRTASNAKHAAERMLAEALVDAEKEVELTPKQIELAAAFA